VFSEQASSVAQRTKLTECLAFLRDGDVLTVTKPDRLARSTAELLSIEVDLTKRGIGLVVLSMGGERLDTRKPTSKLMLTILAAEGRVGSRGDRQEARHRAQFGLPRTRIGSRDTS
jgi:DNA invertase Pin-like site-specific DNA recombinase